MELLQALQGKYFYFVGIKGVGMTALAELLTAKGAFVRGSDVADQFLTDEILQDCRLPIFSGFNEDNVDLPIDGVVYSTAYNQETHPELLKAHRLGLPILTYPEALGQFSRQFISAGICGVHGKTTTTAMTGVLMRALGLPFSALVGSLVPDFGHRATLCLGDTYFVAETCEYKRHFLSFSPSKILLTHIELEHTDYFKNQADIFLAFEEYVHRLPVGGTLVYCADDAGAQDLAFSMQSKRSDLLIVSYGFKAKGRFALKEVEKDRDKIRFRLKGWNQFITIKLPGLYNVLNASGAIALALLFWEEHTGNVAKEEELALLSSVLNLFQGSKRRAQLVGQAGDILVIDDYAHHPTAVRLTIQAIREFYPSRRLVVDFMPHTFSRTKSFFNDFVESLLNADQLVLHKIYASAREISHDNFSGWMLYQAVSLRHSNVKYFEEVHEALPFYLENLHEGDILLTMGAGDNWKVGQAFLQAKAGNV